MTNAAAQQTLSDWAQPSRSPGSAVSGPMLGQFVRRVEDEHLLTGRSTYVANLDLSGALVARFVTAIVAHARITGIDTAEAAAMPGVLDVVTGADLDVGMFPGLPEGTPRPLLATDVVRFVGEPVVAIVATSAEAAADAAEAVVISYEPLPVVIDPEDAATDRTLLFPDLGTNVVTRATGPGQAEPCDFSQCEVVVEGRFVLPRVAPCPLERLHCLVTTTERRNERR